MNRKVNWLVATLLVVLHQVLGAAWYGVFGAVWQSALGRTTAELTARGSMPYGVSILSSLLMVIFFALLFDAAKVRGAAAGARWGLLVWSLLIAPFCFLHAAFSALAWAVAFVDSGMALVLAVVTGAALAGWAPSSRREASPAPHAALS